MFSLRQVIPVALLVVGTCYANVQHNVPAQQKQAQQQHSHPAYIIPTVNRQSGLGGLSALTSLGSSFGGFGGLGGGGGGSGGGLGSLLSSFSGFSGGSMLSTALPLLMVVGLGAMLVPLLGGAFFRESQKRGLPSISPAFVDGLTDILEKFVKALDAMEKKQI